MKNITVSVDDEVYRKARIKAAEQNTSVSALVKAFLTRLSSDTNNFLHSESNALAHHETEFERLTRQEQEFRRRLFAEGRGLRYGDNLTRAEVHERHALR